MLAFEIVAFKSDLVKILSLQLVKALEISILRAFARSREVFGRLRCLPLLKTRRAIVLLARLAFLALNGDIVAKTASQRLDQEAFLK